MNSCTYCGRNIMEPEHAFYWGRYTRFCKPSHMWDFDDMNIFQKLWLWLINS